MKSGIRHSAIIAALFAMGAVACSTLPQPAQRFAVAPVRANGAEVPPGADGSTILESRQPGGAVFVVAEPGFADFGAGFLVATHNKSLEAYDFGPANVEATANGRKLTVLGADALDERVTGRARSYVRANTQTGSVSIEKASASAEREYRYNNYGGCPAGQGTCQIFGDNNGRNYRLDRNQRTLEAETIAEVATGLALNQGAIAQKALRNTSVAPNTFGGGVIVVEPPREGGQIDLVVTINGKKHRFGFAAKPVA